ncbi:MAG: FAD-dependent thymidylate synthase [Treponema sp.]|nr:FAD-dependent thymidylate synthase [Alphaproteobacteria bacterium]MBQ3966211.1 FAD-dependent thymidylate synthase [Treponema sp.]
MRLIEPKAEQLIQKPGIEGVYEIIDQVAGICYDRKELHKDSRTFVENLIDNKHLSPLEFGTIYLKIPYNTSYELDLHSSRFEEYCIVSIDTKWLYVSTNYRQIIENECLDYLCYMCEPTEYHVSRPCFIFTCSRAIADEFARHRTMSVMIKSTRYCKVDDLEICRPKWIKQHHGFLTKDDLDKIIEGCDNPDYIPMDLYWWWYNMYQAEDMYKSLIKSGLKPQQARGVLPMDMATTLCMCGFWQHGNSNEGWDRFLKMRCEKSAHEDAQYLANQVKEILL